ncbi:MAG: DUF6320 domain-containing protein [Oscillospiraceae bacterium]|nr:DUF6320 domain-containing protein [Oscillospiraceae bacterium]
MKLQNHKYCDKCKININGVMEYCPLCQHKLDGENGVRQYPVITTVYRQYEFYFKSLALATTSGGVISCAINLMLPESGFWSFFVLLGIACFWIMLWNVINRRFNIPKYISTQVFIISFISVIWDFATVWHGWSVDYVIPITCTTAMFALAVTGKVMKLPVESFISSMLADALFGVVPIIFYFSGILHIIIPSVICVSVSVIAFAAIVIFNGRSIIVEVQKRFHI